MEPLMKKFKPSPQLKPLPQEIWYVIASFCNIKAIYTLINTSIVKSVNYKKLSDTCHERLELAKRAYILIQKYKKEFPKGDPVTIACQKGRLNDLKTFIQSRTVKDVHTYEGKTSSGNAYTLLGIASRYEQYEIVQYLLSLPGMDVGVADNDGRTAIMYAAANNEKNLDLIKSLLNHKTCSIDAVNKIITWGGTALDYAKNWNDGPLQNEIIQLLKSKGAEESNYEDDY